MNHHRDRHVDDRTLYNGIRLPDQWPPPSNNHWFDHGREPMPVPYLTGEGIPRVVPIDVGRQLFVDDFLIQEHNLTRSYHKPEKYDGNPIVFPERDFEESSVYLVGEPVLWDPDLGMFKMWYSPAHWVSQRAVMYSVDGIHWIRPQLNVVPGTNIIMSPPHDRIAMFNVILDHDAVDPSERFKAHGWEDGTKDSIFFVSSDGLRWHEVGRLKNDFQDTTNIFYNPFRKKWVYNPKYHPKGKRSRLYAEVDSFHELYDPSIHDKIVKWYRACKIDDQSPDLDRMNEAQIYDLFAIPYESLMLGAINVHYGPENNICEQESIPKLMQIHIGFSRDGFHWHRPLETPFIPGQRHKGLGHPEFGYLRPAGNVVNVVGDKLYFYYMSASGIDKHGKQGMYTGITISLATLRRDGFASMDAGTDGGTLLTRPVRFSGKYLFVNVDCPDGALRVEVLSEQGDLIKPLSRANCIPISTDSTCHRVTWTGTEDLAHLSGKPVRFRFHLTRGSLYSFWVTPSETGASFGYIGGGGPGFDTGIDTVGAISRG